MECGVRSAECGVRNGQMTSVDYGVGNGRSRLIKINIKKEQMNDVSNVRRSFPS